MSLLDAEFCGKDRTVFPLTSLSIGFWSSRKSRKVLLLSLPSSKKFVLLSVEDARQKASGRLDKALLQVNSIWDSRNPFNAASPSKEGDSSLENVRWLVAFEVEWGDIVGLDYRFCLLQEGRLVLEATTVVKRVFKTIEDVHAFYEWTPPEQGQPLQHCKSETDAHGWQPADVLASDYEQLFERSTSFRQYDKSKRLHSSDDVWLGGPNAWSGSPRYPAPASMWHRRGESMDAIGAQLTPRGLFRSSMSSLPCTPPRTLSGVHTWPSSELCEALHLMGARHKDASACYRTPSIPGPARFTLPSATYSSQTVILAFCDPHLLSHLATWIKSDVGRVKLYESGLPAWAVFLPSYGFWYHPWMRTAAWVLYMVISIFSMTCGFYDLYKNVPYLKQVVSGVMGRLYLPRYALLEWLEQHAQIRLSILLTYLFSKSPLFASFLRLLTSFMAVVRNLLQPLLSPLFSPLTPFWQSIILASRSFASGCTTLAVTSREVVVVLLGPPMRSTLTFLSTACAMTSEVVITLGGWMSSAVMTPVQVLLLPLWALLAMLGAVCQGCKTSAEQVVAAWRAFRATWGTVKAGGRLVQGGMQAAGPVAQAVPTLTLLQMPGEALDMLKMSVVKVVKALQAVIRFHISLVLKVLQHRVSLSLQAYRYWAIVQAQTCGRLRANPYIARFLPKPVPVALPPRVSMTRSSSSSSIWEGDGDDGDGGEVDVTMLSHPYSCPGLVDSVTDASQELFLPLPLSGVGVEVWGQENRVKGRRGKRGREREQGGRDRELGGRERERYGVGRGVRSQSCPPDGGCEAGEEVWETGTEQGTGVEWQGMRGRERGREREGGVKRAARCLYVAGELADDGSQRFGPGQVWDRIRRTDTGSGPDTDGQARMGAGLISRRHSSKGGPFNAHQSMPVFPHGYFTCPQFASEQLTSSQPPAKRSQPAAKRYTRPGSLPESFIASQCLPRHFVGTQPPPDHSNQSQAVTERLVDPQSVRDHFRTKSVPEEHVSVETVLERFASGHSGDEYFTGLQALPERCTSPVLSMLDQRAKSRRLHRHHAGYDEWRERCTELDRLHVHNADSDCVHGQYADADRLEGQFYGPRSVPSDYNGLQSASVGRACKFRSALGSYPPSRSHRCFSSADSSIHDQYIVDHHMAAHHNVDNNVYDRSSVDVDRNVHNQSNVNRNKPDRRTHDCRHVNQNTQDCLNLARSELHRSTDGGGPPHNESMVDSDDDAWDVQELPWAAYPSLHMQTPVQPEVLNKGRTEEELLYSAQPPVSQVPSQTGCSKTPGIGCSTGSESGCPIASGFGHSSIPSTGGAVVPEVSSFEQEAACMETAVSLSSGLGAGFETEWAQFTFETVGANTASLGGVANKKGESTSRLGRAINQASMGGGVPTSIITGVAICAASGDTSSVVQGEQCFQFGAAARSQPKQQVRRRRKKKKGADQVPSSEARA